MVGVLTIWWLLFGTLPYENTIERVLNVKDGWPTQVAGRSLQTVTPDHVLYAVTENTAEKLRISIENELRSFKETYAASCDLPTIVVSMEAGLPERLPFSILWNRPSYEYRPYTLTERPYFHETICLSDPTEVKPFFPELREHKFCAVCLLNTDDEFFAAFDAQVYKQWHDYEKSLAQVPEEVRKMSRIALPLMEAAAWIGFSKMRQLDLDLMILRRREVLWLPWLKCVYKNGEQLNVEAKKLSNEITARWKQLYSKKPKC